MHTVLLVGESQDNHVELIRELSAAMAGVRFWSAMDADDAYAVMAGIRVDCVIAEEPEGPLGGLPFFVRLKARWPNVKRVLWLREDSPHAERTAPMRNDCEAVIAYGLSAKEIASVLSPLLRDDRFGRIPPTPKF
jgi:hypothetical protein